MLSITEEDLQGLMEVVHGLQGTSLDLIIHSPGGSPTATEALVTYIGTKFDDIRVIIPHAAMSAATMLACSANRIMMRRHSFIGPIDPQIILNTKLGTMSVQAYERKMPPAGETVIDGQTGEEYHARWGVNYFSDPTTQNRKNIYILGIKVRIMSTVRVKLEKIKGGLLAQYLDNPEIIVTGDNKEQINKNLIKIIDGYVEAFPETKNSFFENQQRFKVDFIEV